jgi:predicted RNA binding protein YcfA (HicA-like mRNA interferase family)
MKGRLPSLSGKEVARLLEKRGFANVHQKGSHAKYRDPGGRTTVVPMHGSEEIALGLLRKILLDAGIDPDDLRKE